MRALIVKLVHLTRLFEATEAAPLIMCDGYIRERCGGR